MSRKKNKQSLSNKRKVKILISRIRFWSISLTFLIIITLTLVGKTKQFFNYLVEEFYNYTASHGIKFNNLVISSVKNIPKQAIIEAMDIKPNTPLLAIDLYKIKKNIEKINWVKTTIIERKLPDTIYIGIRERKPIAIWQNNYLIYLIDDEGFIIPIENIGNFSHLLLVTGGDATSHTKKLIEDLKAHPELAKFVLSATRYGERRWNLILKEDITVKMPEIGFEKAWAYLNKLYKQQKLFGNQYKIIDLRAADKSYIEKHQ